MLRALVLSALVLSCGAPTPAPDAGADAGIDAGPGGRILTVHYHRPAGDYTGWQVVPSAGAPTAPVSSTMVDGWGATFPVELDDGATTLTFTFRKDATTDAAGPITVAIEAGTEVVYAVSGSPLAIPRTPPAVPGADQAALYYLRPGGDYTGWGLHTWGNQARNTEWTAPLLPSGQPDPTWGAGFVIELPRNTPQGNCPAGNICFIVHQGDTKDPGPDILSWNPATMGNIVFVTSGSAAVNLAPVAAGTVELSGAEAHLVSRDILLWTRADGGTRELRFSPTAAITVSGGGVDGGTSVALTRRSAALPADVAARVPHLSTFTAYDVAWGTVDPGEALRGQLHAVARDATGNLSAVTRVQAPFALDELFGTDEPLGVTWDGGAPSVALWAPTAREVTLEVADAAKASLASVAMTRGPTGVWSHAGPASWRDAFYRFVVKVYHPDTDRIETFTVTDPYAVNLSTDSRWAQLVDLADPSLRPEGWDTLAKPPLASISDTVLYEVHVRDFSVNDLTVPAERRGKYLGFVTPDGGTRSDGLAYFHSLAQAGVTHVHLLPAFDIATVPEDPAARVDLDQPFSRLCTLNPATPAALCSSAGTQTVRQVLAGLAGDSEQQQAVAAAMARVDAFNWGYDPFHFNAPEGSYASTAEGPARIREFRQMVKGLSDIGLRTVMDVVYNHTNAAGVASTSVLDKVVPGYYHRRDQRSGAVATSTCCANTATEHRMMRRLMKDSLVLWAREYKVDGFRFDLMGHHMVADMVEVRDALRALNPTVDGVDGSRIVLYGEGWDFGEVASGARGRNATQQNLAGTGIATFNDRLRDAVRGGGPFDSGDTIRRTQGFSTGLFTQPNELSSADAGTLASLLSSTDVVKVGMAGNLREFRLVNAAGQTVNGVAVRSGGGAAGYTSEPFEAVSYVSAHDNQTLWDIQQYKLATSVSSADRARMVLVGLAPVALGQGLPFFHMADELLRSKSMERDSYDSGDWFNRVDWTFQSTAWRSGLPSKEKDETNWPLIRTVFANPDTTPAPADIARGRDGFLELLRVRSSSPLFRLRTAAEVKTRVDYLNSGADQVPGLVVQTITDGTCAGADLDPAREAVVVFINAAPVERTFTVPQGAGFTLHAALQASTDPVVKTAAVSGDSFTVPGRTAAVFEKLQAGAQGAGLPCNTR